MKMCEIGMCKAGLSGECKFVKKIILILFSLFCCFFIKAEEEAKSDVSEQLQRLKIAHEYVKDGDFFSVTIANAPNRIIVENNTQMNTRQQIVRQLLCLFQPLYLTDENIEKIKDLIAKNDSDGGWGCAPYGKTAAHIVYYVAEIPAQASDDVLAKTIIRLSTLKYSPAIDEAFQAKCAIYDVLIQDVNPPAKDRASVVRHMKSIDLSLCPERFQNAYKTHIAAWGNHSTSGTESAAALGALAGSGGGTDREGALAGLIIGGLIGAIADEEEYSSGISNTYAEVLSIAQSYGVDVSSFR